MEDVYYVVAWPSEERVFRELAHAVVDQTVVTFRAQHNVGTFAGPNVIVAGTSKKDLVSSEGAVLLILEHNADEAILARPAQQVVTAPQGEEHVAAALAYEVVVPMGPRESVRTIGTYLVDRQSHPAGQ